MFFTNKFFFCKCFSKITGTEFCEVEHFLIKEIVYCDICPITIHLLDYIFGLVHSQPNINNVFLRMIQVIVFNLAKEILNLVGVTIFNPLSWTFWDAKIRTCSQVKLVKELNCHLLIAWFWVHTLNCFMYI